MKEFVTEEYIPDDIINANTMNPLTPFLITASDVKPEKISFLWYPYLIDNNVNVLGGKAGTGKTWLLCALMAAISSNVVPDDMPGEIRKTGKVLYFGGEDGNGAIAERLTRLNCNLDNIVLCEKSFDATDPAFADLIEEEKPTLVVFDPLMSYLKEGTNVNDPVTAKQSTDKLRDIARDYNTCILNVIHPPKKEYFDLGDRYIGSGGYIAGARSATYIGYHPTDPTKRVAVQTKNNATYSLPAVFALDPDIGFYWCGDDSRITKKMVSEADGGSGIVNGNLQRYIDVVLEVMKFNPKGINMTAKEILDEYASKVRKHDIDVKVFGKALNTDAFSISMESHGYQFAKGANTGNRQQYTCYSFSLMEV